MSKWKTYRLGEICDLVAGFAFKSNHFGNYANQVIKIADIQPPIVKKELMGVDLSTYDANKLKKYIVSRGDFVLAMTGATIGKIGRVTNDTKAYINQRVLTFRPNPLIIDKSYLYYLLSVEKFNKYILNHIDSETAQPNISANSIGGYEISLPPLAEQKRIADILGAIDDKIELNRRINANLEQQAQALYKSWFLDNNTNKIRLEEVVKTTSGGTPSRSHTEYYGGNYGWIKSKELNGSFISKTEESITDLAILKSSAKILPEMSVLIAMYGATVGQYAITSKPMTCNQAICALLSNENYPYTYLFMVAKNKKEELINNAVGSAQQNISQVIIKDLLISNDIAKIKEFHHKVAPIFGIIRKNTEENIDLSTLRDTLLPKLMSGEITV